MSGNFAIFTLLFLFPGEIVVGNSHDFSSFCEKKKKNNNKFKKNVQKLTITTKNS